MVVFIAQTTTNIGLQLGFDMPSYSTIYFLEVIILIPLSWIRKIGAMTVPFLQMMKKWKDVGVLIVIAP